MSYKLVQCCLLLMMSGGLSMHDGGLDAPLLGGGGSATPTIEGLQSELQVAHARIRQLEQEQSRNLTTMQWAQAERDRHAERSERLSTEVSRLDGTQLGRLASEATGIATNAVQLGKKYGPCLTLMIVGVFGAFKVLVYGGETFQGDSSQIALNAICLSKVGVFNNIRHLHNAAADAYNKDSTAATREAMITQDYAMAQRAIEAAECYHTLAQQTGDSADQANAKLWSVNVLAWQTVVACSVQSWVNNNNAGYVRAIEVYNAVNKMTDAEVAASEAQYKAELEGLMAQCIKDSVALR